MTTPRSDLTWRKSGGGLSLHLGRQASALLHVVPDKTYAGMWRIEYPDGRLSDMANLTRAKDAASGIAIAMLDRQKQVQEQRLASPSVRSADTSHRICSSQASESLATPAPELPTAAVDSPGRQRLAGGVVTLGGGNPACNFGEAAA